MLLIHGQELNATVPDPELTPLFLDLDRIQILFKKAGTDLEWIGSFRIKISSVPVRRNIEFFLKTSCPKSPSQIVSIEICTEVEMSWFEFYDFGTITFQETLNYIRKPIYSSFKEQIWNFLEKFRNWN